MVVAKIAATDVSTLQNKEFKEPWLLAAWINRNGEYFQVTGTYGHSELADQIVGTAYDAWFLLESEGWVHLSERGSVDISTQFRPTKAQINTLFDIAMLVPESLFGQQILSELEALN